MERRRKYNRHFLQTMHASLPLVLLVTQFSILLALCSFFVLVDYADCIMTFPDDSGVYSLFPDEDLKTGRKRLRFDDETTIRNYRDGRDFLVRSYPMLPQDRLHRPVGFGPGGGGSGNRQTYDDDFRLRDRERHGRVYFDDSFRSSRFDFHRLTPRPRPIERPVNPIVFETSRRPPPLHHHPHHHHRPFIPENFPPGPPAIGQSKLPPGAVSRASGEDIPTRIHVFNPESNSFGNPRNAGGGSGENDDGPSSSERAKGPPSNFVETGPPGPESFFNHEQFLEYQKKIAFARFHEQDASGKGGGSSAADGAAGRKVLFESKEPFEIDGLVPPDKSGENKEKLGTTNKQAHGQGGSSSSTGAAKEQKHLQILVQQQKQHDQRQHQRVEGQKVRGAGNNQQHHRNRNEETEEDTGGGEVESDVVNEKGDEVKSENGKSEVTQLPPTHITKTGRPRSRHQQSSNSGSASDHSRGDDSRSTNKKFTPSISYNEGGGGTGFKLPTTATSYSDEPHNLNGFVPVVPFQSIGPEQPRAISLERPRQQQQQHIVPHHHNHDHEAPVYSTTASTSTTTSRSITSGTSTIRSIPVTTTIASTTARSKGDKSGFRPSTEVTKSYTSSSSPFSVISPPDNGPENNAGNNPSGAGGLGASSPASPILHATAGERSNSETHTKVAITKQQELKRLQKQRQLSSSMHTHHQLITPPTHSSSSAGLFPDLGLGDSSASSDSADNSDNPVTRIKTVTGPSSASQETSEKTIVASRGRPAKPAVIIGSTAAGVRPKVVGSVVEAGPAWPGLVSNFLRQNGQYNSNRSFTATATVRPRGNSGTNPSPPSSVITGQVQHIAQAQVQQQQQIQQKQIQTPRPHHHQHRQQSPHTPPPPPQQLQQQRPPPPTKATEFQLQQIRIPSVTSISSGTQIANIANNNPSANNHHNDSSSITRNGDGNTVSANSNLAKQVQLNGKISANSSNYNGSSSSNNNNNNTNNSSSDNDSKTHSIARRLYSSEEDSSSAQIRSNSSTGIVSLVHAHISHCPKLHSPTEVICDVHIREGHGVPNPQLTVGWRRKFYNSTQPDVLLTLNKAPASGENGHFEPHHSVMEVVPGNNSERLEEFHDKFNVTLAPGISPMLRSVLLIRSVTVPDCGTYQCEVNDGINVLKSETLLFLCH